MTTDDQFSGGAAATSLDQIGKVFIALAQDVRKCLWDRFRGVCSAQKGKPWLETEEQNAPLGPPRGGLYSKHAGQGSHGLRYRRA
jgi:hypothetical protein